MSDLKRHLNQFLDDIIDIFDVHDAVENRDYFAGEIKEVLRAHGFEYDQQIFSLRKVRLSTEQDQQYLDKLMKVGRKDWAVMLRGLGVPIDLFVDIGAGNQFGDVNEAEVFKKSYPKAKVVGYEPCRDRFDSMENYPGELHAVAIGAERGTETFYLEGRDDKEHRRIGFSHLLRKNPISERIIDSHQVEVRTLDNQIAAHSQGLNIFIWADVEGMELDILKGAKELLSSGRVVGLNLEVTPHYHHGWASRHEVIGLCALYGFVPCFTWRDQSDIILLKRELAERLPHSIDCLNAFNFYEICRRGSVDKNGEYK